MLIEHLQLLKEHLEDNIKKGLCAQRGPICIIRQPQPSHGALGPAQGARRTVLPWYIRLQDDNNTLEIVEAGAWEGLSLTHISKSLP